MNKFIILLIILLTISCQKPPQSHSVIIGLVRDQYKILEIDPPKHFDISIQSLRTGIIYNEIGNRKHCNSWRSGPSIGSIITLTTIIHKDTIENYFWYEPLDEEVINLYCR